QERQGQPSFLHNQTSTTRAASSSPEAPTIVDSFALTKRPARRLTARRASANGLTPTRASTGPVSTDCCRQSAPSLPHRRKRAREAKRNGAARDLPQCAS